MVSFNKASYWYEYKHYCLNAFNPTWIVILTDHLIPFFVCVLSWRGGGGGLKLDTNLSEIKSLSQHKI